MAKKGWEKASLGELTSVITKGTTPTTMGKSFQNQGINFIKVESITEDGEIIEDKLQKIDMETHQILKRSQIKQGDILFSIAGAIGRTILIDDVLLPANTNQALAIIRPIAEKIDTRFLYYYLRSSVFQNFSLSRVVQTAQANVSLSILSSAPILIPQKSIQRKISNILCNYDKLRRNNIKRIEILEKIAFNIYKEWFIKLRFPGHSKVKMVKSELGEIPEGWGINKIDEVALTTDFVANGSFATIKKNVRLYDTPEYSLFVRTTDFNNGFKGNFKYTDKHSFDFLAKSRLYGNEFIISNVGDTGSVFKAPVWVKKPMTLGSNCILIRSETYDEYLFYYFKSYKGQHAIDSIVSGSAQPKFNKTEFRKLKVLIPTNEINWLFKNQVKSIWEQLIDLYRKQSILRETRDLLLPRLISGELDVENLDVKVDS